MPKRGAVSNKRWISSGVTGNGGESIDGTGRREFGHEFFKASRHCLEQHARPAIAEILKATLSR